MGRWSPPRRARGVVLLVLVVLLQAPPATAGQGAGVLPDVDIALVLEVRDSGGWMTLYQEVLGTPAEAQKWLGVGIGARTGGERWIVVLQPKFTTEVIVARGVRAMKVVVTGRIAGADALRELAPFEEAVLEIQAGAVDNELVLAYGLASTTAQLLELHLARP